MQGKIIYLYFIKDKLNFLYIRCIKNAQNTYLKKLKLSQYAFGMQCNFPGQNFVEKK